jgi:hypothetical protein
VYERDTIYQEPIKNMKNNTIIKVFAVTMLVIAFAITAIVSVNAFTVEGDNTDAAAANMSTGGNNTDAADTNTSTGGSLNTGGNNTDAGTGALNVGGNNTDAADTNTSTGGSLNVGGNNTDASNTSDPVTPGTDTDSDNDDNDNNGGRRDRTSGNSISSNATVTLANSCPLITSPMIRRGARNNAAEVAKLQAFLKNVEGLNVTVTGTFDIQTEAAVHAFQKKYATEVLLPWGGTKSSGIVYITTSKKINQITCAAPLNLSAAELSIINSYRSNVIANRANNTGTQVIGNTQTSGSVAVGTTGATSTGTTSSEVNDNVANPSGTSVASRFWNFIVGLFR